MLASFFSFHNYTALSLVWKGLPATLPFVLFAFSGFEAVCSLSQSIENPQKNGPKAIFYAFSIVLTILCFYQLCFFGIAGKTLSLLAGYKEAFPLLFSQLFHETSSAARALQGLCLIGIACSSLGASYGILYSNAWNLFTLAKKNHIPSFFAFLNRYSIPVGCISTQIIAALGYIWTSAGNQIHLQQLSASGSTTAYTLSIAAFIYATFSERNPHYFKAVLAAGSCFLLITTLIKNGLKFGFRAYFIFLLLSIAGALLYLLYPKLAYFKGN